MEDITPYTPCLRPFKWVWKVNALANDTTLVPYKDICVHATPADSLLLSVRFIFDDPYLTPTALCTPITKTFSKFYMCTSGSMRRGVFTDEEEIDMNSLTAYPIPFQDLLHIRMDTEDQGEDIAGMIKIYDMQGKIVYLDRKIFTDDDLTIDLGILADGVYEMQVIDEKGNHYRVKLIKTRN